MSATTATTGKKRPRPLQPLAELTVAPLLFPDEVARLLGWGRRTFDRAVAVGDFPPADIRRGAKLVQWKRETVQAGIEQLAAATRDGE